MVSQYKTASRMTGFLFQSGAEIFLFSSAFRLVLRSTQPVERVPESLYPKVKQPELETDYSPPSSVEVKNAWS
jgi:hypothetical protein